MFLRLLYYPAFAFSVVSTSWRFLAALSEYFTLQWWARRKINRTRAARDFSLTWWDGQLACPFLSQGRRGWLTKSLPARNRVLFGEVKAINKAHTYTYISLKTAWTLQSSEAYLHLHYGVAGGSVWRGWSPFSQGLRSGHKNPNLVWRELWH